MDKTRMRVRVARENDVGGCKRIADQHREGLGFVSQALLADAVRKNQLLVADREEEGILGFVRFNHRRSGIETALYSIAVKADSQQRGIGKALIDALVKASQTASRRAIVLKCPEGLPANLFYERLGFRRLGIEPGRRRQLVIWRFDIPSGPCNS